MHVDAEWDGIPPRVARYLAALGDAMAAPMSPEHRSPLMTALAGVRARFPGGDHALLSQTSHVAKWMMTGPPDRPAVVARLATVCAGALQSPLIDRVLVQPLEPLALHERLTEIEADGRARPAGLSSEN